MFRTEEPFCNNKYDSESSEQEQFGSADSRKKIENDFNANQIGLVSKPVVGTSEAQTCRSFLCSCWKTGLALLFNPGHVPGWRLSPHERPHVTAIYSPALVISCPYLQACPM